MLGVVVAAVGFGMYESLFRKSGAAALETSTAMAAPLTAYPGFEQVQPLPGWESSGVFLERSPTG